MSKRYVPSVKPLTMPIAKLFKKNPIVKHYRLNLMVAVTLILVGDVVVGVVVTQGEAVVVKPTLEGVDVASTTTGYQEISLITSMTRVTSSLSVKGLLVVKYNLIPLQLHLPLQLPLIHLLPILPLSLFLRSMVLVHSPALIHHP